MAKLYPPYIESTLPSSFSTTEIKIPFGMNRAVSKSEVKGFILKFMTVKNELITTAEVKDNISENSDIWKNMEISFNLNLSSANPEEMKNIFLGQFYKVQLAYIDKYDTIGYYSEVGIIKLAQPPRLRFRNNSASSNQQKYMAHQYHYIVEYKPHNMDPNEKLYSSHFVLSKELDNNEKEIIIQTEEKLHNYNLDTSDEIIEQFDFLQELEKDKVYNLEFVATTVNKGVLKINTKITQQEIQSDIDIKNLINFQANLNYNNAYINLKISINSEGIENDNTYGHFVINRFDGKLWQELTRLTIYFKNNFSINWKDFLIEHNKIYKYAIQQYNSHGVYSQPIESESVLADFEDIFLYDGEKQLKIRFNPKISSIKSNILENKVDTIGGKYPFVFRNGRVNYKEIPISGLISYQMDEEHLFFNNYSYQTDLLSPQNLELKTIVTEREFRDNVFNWLNNGKIKYFKSSIEGNALLRLMNISLSPNDTLGRMLYSFNATGYEIGELIYENFIKYNLINLKVFQLNQEESIPDTITKTIELNDIMINTNGIKTLYNSADNNGSQLKYFKFEDILPGTIFILGENQQQFIIGRTGTYESNIPTSYLGIQGDIKEGIVHLNYEKRKRSKFDSHQAVSEIRIFGKQMFWNKSTKIESEDDDITEILLNLDNELTYDPKERALKLYYLKAFKRDIIDLYQKDDQYYTDRRCLEKFDITNENIRKLCNIYHIYNGIDLTETNTYIDGYSLKQYIITNPKNLFKIQIISNDTGIEEELITDIDLQIINNYSIVNKNIFNNMPSIKIGFGVLCEIGYKLSETIYDNNIETVELKNKYNYLKDLQELKDQIMEEENAISLDEIILKEQTIQSHKILYSEEIKQNLNKEAALNE